MTKKTYYTLILNREAPALRGPVLAIDELRLFLIQTYDLIKINAGTSADADLKETVSPEPLDERFVRAFQKRHSAVFDGVNVATLSFYRFRAQAKGPTPLMHNWLVSLRQIVDVRWIENGAGELITFEKLLADQAPPKKGLETLLDKSLGDLKKKKDLHEVFRRAKVVQAQNRCIEDLLMSDSSHHWKQAAERIDADESVCDVLETLISIYESTKDLEIQRALLTAIHRATAICLGKMESVPALNSAKVTEYEEKGKSVITSFLSSRFAQIGHADLFGKLRDLAQSSLQ